MSRMRFGLVAVALLSAVAGAAGSLYWALTRVPDFYENAVAVSIDPAVRRRNAEQFRVQTVQFVESIRRESVWSEEFTQDQINSWIIEDLQQRYAKHLPAGISDPRVLLRDGELLLGFRYREPGFNGVVSLRLKPWLAEPNRLALEIESIRAGLVPVPLEKVIDNLTAHLERAGWRVEWTQSEEGRDVAVVHLDRPEMNRAVLEGVEVTDGAIRLTGTGGPKRERIAGGGE